MPRLTSVNYLNQRSELSSAYQDEIPILVYFSYQEQLVLNDYFAPTKQLTDKEALSHRLAVTKTNPSLPQRAGKLMKRVEGLLEIDWSKVSRPIGKNSPPFKVFVCKQNACH